MNHADISRRLALAIGYPLECIRDLGVCACVYRDGGPYGGGEGWYTFDYRHPSVALPVLEWLGSEYRQFFWWCAPTNNKGARWSSNRGIVADTLPEAIALSAIEVAR